jgi:FtsP/CotA-like multicopper oxidase with cupredoxin domain
MGRENRMDRRQFLRNGGVALAGGLGAASTGSKLLRAAGLPPQAKPDYPHTWTINNQSWPNVDPIRVDMGKRYRLLLRNGSGDQHSILLHRHSFEVAKIGSKQLSGLRKDVINGMPLETVAVDFRADNPGDTLIHCHQQLHMDFGFMQIIKYNA